MRNYNVAILGATGAVGQEMLKILHERRFPINELKCLASARSVGKKLAFGDDEIAITEANDAAFRGCDIVLGAAEADVAEQFVPAIKASGAVFVDNSSAFRLDPDVPLVVPEINGADVALHHGIIASPNCSTTITLIAINALAKLSPIKTLVASTYQAVSGAGTAGLVELEEQIRAYARGDELKVSAFPHQIAFNLVPRIGSITENGYSTEEMKLQNEGRKIMHLPLMRVSCTCIRVPVLRSHSISATIQTERRISLDEARAAIAKAEGVKLVDDPAHDIYPMPLDTSDKDIVLVGRIREDLALDNALSLWCCGDQIRKGAATNTIQIAELLI